MAGLCLICLIFVGDGGEDVSCVLESWHLERSDTDSGGVFPASYVDSFLDTLKCYFVEALVYPRIHMGRRFTLLNIVLRKTLIYQVQDEFHNCASFPNSFTPVKTVLQNKNKYNYSYFFRGSSVYNTECEKDTRYYM